MKLCFMGVHYQNEALAFPGYTVKMKLCFMGVHYQNEALAFPGYTVKMKLWLFRGTLSK